MIDELTQQDNSSSIILVSNVVSNDAMLSGEQVDINSQNDLLAATAFSSSPIISNSQTNLSPLPELVNLTVVTIRWK